MNVTPYFKIMRIDKPIGTALLWFPTAWALWVAYQGHPPLSILSYFFLGTFLMRSAGCVMNDLADRNIDKHVRRTKERPLATGALSVSNALVLLAVLLILALLIVLQLPRECLIFAFMAVGISLGYPFCKRYLQGPQLILSLAFSMGIPMAFASSGRGFPLAMYGLFLINFLWILTFDTMYAMVDKEDDLKIGVKSTAIWFGRRVNGIICLLQCLHHLLWLPIAYFMHWGLGFYLSWGCAIILLCYQQQLLKSTDHRDFFKAFMMSAWYGLVLWVGIMIS